MQKVTCEYCDNEFKNNHGLHIHWFYCATKVFSEMPVSYVKFSNYAVLLGNDKLIYVFHYPTSFLKYVKDNEVGIMIGKRYVLR